MIDRARWAGWCVQGITLGVLLFFAVSKLLAVAEGARVFRYQGF